MLVISTNKKICLTSNLQATIQRLKSSSGGVVRYVSKEDVHGAYFLALGGGCFFFAQFKGVNVLNISRIPTIEKKELFHLKIFI